MHSKRRKHQSLQYPGWELDHPKPARGCRPLPEAGVSHLKREAISSRFPVLVTLKILHSHPSLRTGPCHEVLRKAFDAGRDRPGRLEGGSFRLVHYAVVDHHLLNLIVEAKDRESLSRGMQGLSIRVAKALNRLWGTKGTIYADRYDDRILRSQEEVNEALGQHLKMGTARPRYTSETGPEDARPTSSPRSRLLKDADPEG